MTTFALLSELHRLTPKQLDCNDLHVICDDGDWTEAQISVYINQWSGHSILHARDPDGEEERQGTYR